MAEKSSARSRLPSGDPFEDLALRLAEFSSRRVRVEEFTGYRSIVYEADTPIWGFNQDADNLFLVASGFAYQFDILGNGRRHISDFFGPGAICNWTRLEAPTSRTNILFRRGSVATVLPKEHVRTVLGRVPELRMAISRHELARTLRNSQRTKTLVALEAPERVICFLLDLHEERRMPFLEGCWIECPFNQQELGDLLGMSGVHVSRTLSTLVDEGRIARNGRHCQILDPEGEMRGLGYQRFMTRTKREGGPRQGPLSRAT